MTKISVLMPVYKTPEAYLREAIESILNQSYSDFELLILDDCPDDNREQIVKSYRDKRIKYLQNEKNLGITPSRNKLIALAKGEYLAIFDHDDISLPDRLAKQAAVLDANPDIGVVGCQVEFFQNQSRISKYPQNDQDIKVALMATCALIHPGAMIRKKLLLENNIRYEKFQKTYSGFSLFVAHSFPKHSPVSNLLFCCGFKSIQRLSILDRKEKRTAYQ